jgi:hypothetical protein
MMRRFTFLLRLGLTLGAVGIALVGGHAQAQNAPPHVPGRILVQFNPRATAEQVRSLVAAGNTRDAGEIPHTSFHILQLPPQASETAMARAFAQRPEVAFAELDEIRKPDAVPNDPGYGNQWHLPKISAPAAWDTATGSSSVIIAILDTGCDPTHPDLAPKYVPGWNFYDGTSNTSDVYGHGTATAGTATAYANNGNGIASVAWNCKIMPIRISDVNGYASFSTAASGLTWAADHGARVANISYQMTNSSAISSAAQYFMSKGGVVTISAGNYSTVHTNADNPYVLTVDATDSSDNLASWSDSGADVDIAAPGVDIYTTCNGGGYGSWSGTSFSAPIVAGVAALVISANPALTGAQVQDILKSSSDDLGAPGWDLTYGAGRVNAARAVAAAVAAVTTSNTAPTIAKLAAASANPVTGKTVGLSVLGADDGGEASLIYTWSATGPAAVSFSANGSNAAKSTTATFSQAGSYNFTVTVKDAGGLNATSSVSVTVSQTATTVAVTPGSATDAVNSPKQFSRMVKDQFGTALSAQPACTWTVSGGGTIDATGLFMAGPTPGGPFNVMASAGVVGMATVTVTPPADTNPPTALITSPYGGKVSGTITVIVGVSDDVGVVKVELYVDGKLASTDTASPWSFSLNTNKWKSGTSHTLLAKAYDAAGNVGVSGIVAVTK